MKKIALLKTIFLIGILTLSLLPIGIYADTIPSNEPASYSFHIDMVDHQSKSIPTANTTINGSEYYYDLCVDINLRNSYIGYITVNITYSYYSYVFDSSTNLYSYQRPSKTVSHSVYVNGNSAEWHDNFKAYDNSFYPEVGINSLSITTSNVVETSEESMYLDISDINNKMDTLADLLERKEWSFPMESLNIVAYFFYTHYDKLTDYLYSNNAYIFPGFMLNNGDKIVDKYLTKDRETRLIFITNKNITNINQVSTFLNIPQNITINSFSNTALSNASPVRRLVNITFTASSSGDYLIKANDDNFLVIPIYLQYTSYKNITTDFALLFGLSNQLLDDLHIISSGTNQSQSSSSAADQENASFSDQASDLYDQENDFISDFQDSLDDVSPDFNMSQGFGSLFMTSATWVRDQFDNIVDNTPFASLLTFSLTLGIGLLIIGKVIHK